MHKLGSRVRITAQLIDTATGAHVWAERYDRDIQGMLDVQDEITGMIVATLFRTHHKCHYDARQKEAALKLAGI